MPFFEFEVGKPFAGEVELKTGLLTTLDTSKGDNGIEALFVASLPNIDPREIDALVLESIHFGILIYEPLVFILLRASGPTFLDSPFGIGLYRWIVGDARARGTTFGSFLEISSVATRWRPAPKKKAARYGGLLEVPHNKGQIWLRG
jgi:hypothetical protein